MEDSTTLITELIGIRSKIETPQTNVPKGYDLKDYLKLKEIKILERIATSLEKIASQKN